MEANTQDVIDRVMRYHNAVFIKDVELSYISDNREFRTILYSLQQGLSREQQFEARQILIEVANSLGIIVISEQF